MSIPPRTAPPLHDTPVFVYYSTRALVDSLRTVVSINYAHLARVVARLDTTGTTWVLTLDIDSPAEDHWWAMVDVVKVLKRGAHAAEHARTTPHLSLVRNGACPLRRRTDPHSGRLPDYG